MKLLLILCAVACLSSAASTFVDEDFTLVEEQTTAPVDENEAIEAVMAEEVTTRKSPVRVATATSSPKAVAIVDAVEMTTQANKVPKTSNRPRPSGSRRKQPTKATNAALEEEESSKAEMTSPASVDTASVSGLAPKNFKPTSKPFEEVQQTQGLMEFLRKRKIERIQASTTEDPFASILATATAPSIEEPVSLAGLSKNGAPIRSSNGFPKRLPTTNRRFGASPRATTAATTTTTTPATEAPTVAAAITKRPNRFAALRSSKALSASTTTTAQPVTEGPKPTEFARSKLFPKRPTNFRPVGNSISRRKDQTTTTTPAAPDVVEEDVIISIPEELETIAEPITAAPLRRTRGRIASRVSGI